MLRDEHNTLFQRQPQLEQTPLKQVVIFVMVRGDRTDSLVGALRTGPDGYETVYTMNGKPFLTKSFATEELARDALRTHQRALADVGWVVIAVHP